MKKLLLCILMLLMMTCAACADKTQEEPPAPGEESPGQVEEPTGPQLISVNIYHLGIVTTLDLTEEQTQDLANRLNALLESAAQTDSMDTAPADSANPIQVMAGQTALELVYSQEIELPFAEDVAPPTAVRLLYSIPYVGSDGGLLYTGVEIYEETPVGKLFDQALQDAIYTSAADQVERASFNAANNQVTINGQEYAYESGDDAAELPSLLLNRMLYRTMAFYLNAFSGNVDGLKMMSTSELTDALAAVREGQSTDNELGEETIIKLNQYVLVDYFLPEAIIAPVEHEGSYSVSLRLNEKMMIQIYFVMEEDIPLVSSFHLIMAD